MSMPDTWEYPWFAACDLAFHCVALVHVDPAFAKYQLSLLCREWFQHPTGALPVRTVAHLAGGKPEAERAEAEKRERRKVLALNRLGDAAMIMRREFVTRLLARRPKVRASSLPTAWPATATC
jgi:hypothetical protein